MREYCNTESFSFLWALFDCSDASVPSESTPVTQPPLPSDLHGSSAPTEVSEIEPEGETFDLNVSTSDEDAPPSGSHSPTSRHATPQGIPNVKRAGRRQKSPTPSPSPQPQQRAAPKSTQDVWMFVEKGAHFNRCQFCMCVFIVSFIVTF